MSKRIIDSAWAHKILESIEAASPVDTTDSALVAPYLKAAATLDVFTRKLIPLNGPGGKDAFEFLSDQSRPANLPDGRVVWRLTDTHRRAVLRKLTREEMLAVIRQNPEREMTVSQRMLERYLLNDAPDIQSCNITDIAAIQKVSSRYRQQLENLPAEEELQARMDMLRLAFPFVELTKNGFHGRHRNLNEVREYLGVSERRSSISKITSWVIEDVLSFQEKPPLVVYGTGGIGKSTLLAKAILEHSFDSVQNRVPFVYLNFENPDLSIEEPLTIVVEAVQQIAIQIPDARKDAFDLMDFAYDTMSHTTYGEEQESATGRAHQNRRDECVQRFHNFLSSWSATDLPLLFALDTFERVQISAANWTDKLWAFLENLQNALPRLRIIVAGRRPVDGLPSRNVELKELDHVSAIEFLKESLEDVPDIKIDDIKEIAATLGGNPLSLKLASSALKRIGIREVLGGVRRRHWFLLPVRDSQIQGQLYRRILDHIDDKDVRQLAHPGLTLRRITPRVIREVLAEPCEIDVPTDDAAADLCDRLEAYADLVTRDVDGSLRHREDVRRIMLPALTADQPAKVACINAAAVRYYEARSNETGSVLHRTEELYHRLVIGDDEKVLRTRWIDAARERLADYEDEFTPSSRVFLRTMLRLSIDDKMFESAATETWEREAIRRAEEFLANEKPDSALKVLRAREARSGLPRIVRLEAELLEKLAKGEGVNEVFENGINAALEQNNLGHYIELSTAYLRTLEDRQQFSEALKILARLREIADQSISDDTRLQLDLQEMRLLRKLRVEPTEPGKQAKAAQLYLGLDSEVLLRNKNISIQAAAELGDVPAVLARALTITPPAPLSKTSDDINEIASVIGEDENLHSALPRKEKHEKLSDVLDRFIKPAHQTFRMQLAEQMMESRLKKDTMDALVQLYRMSLE